MRCLLHCFMRLMHTKLCIMLLILTCVLLLGRVYQNRQNYVKHKYFNIEKYLFNLTFQTQLEKFVPGLFLNDLKANTKNNSYCMYNYNLPESFDASEKYLQFTPEVGIRSEYRVIYNVIQPSMDIEYSKFNVTYCTHATPEFFYYITETLRRWQGPVSIASFVPFTDATLLMCQVERLCRCLPDMSRVSLHFVFPAEHPPEITTCPLFYSKTETKCTLPPDIYKGGIETFRNTEVLTYPINVARNVARMRAETTFVLVSDVELFPSKNLVPKFISMIDKLQKKSGMILDAFLNKLVYVLPVFEIDSYENIPDVKSKLLNLYTKNKAFYFHRWVCSHCQRFPGLQRWIIRDKTKSDKIIEPFFVVRREYPFHRWEPVFIGTNSEPLYSEILSWEGQQDKMTQMHEMCLMQYRFVILDGAFLVHSPGIKRKSDIPKDNWSLSNKEINRRHYDKIVQIISSKIKHNSRCRIH